MLKIFFASIFFILSLYSNPLEKAMEKIENSNFQEAKKYYLENCGSKETNDDYCYYNSGIFFGNERFDKEEVISFFENSCENKIINSCTALALYYSFDSNLGIKKDIEKSLYYYDKACQLGDDRSCVELGLTFSGRFYNYEISYKDNKKAIKYLRKSCIENQQYSSCGVLGVIYIEEKEYAEAKHFSKIACDKKSPRACYELGMIYFIDDENKKLAKKYLNQSCEFKYKAACLKLEELE